MKQAIADLNFFDIREGVFRSSGDTFLCDDQRGEYLAGLGLVRVKDVPEEEPKKTRKVVAEPDKTVKAAKKQSGKK